MRIDDVCPPRIGLVKVQENDDKRSNECGLKLRFDGQVVTFTKPPNIEAF